MEASRRTEIFAGISGALSSIPLNIASGAVAFAPLGSGGAAAGAAAALVSTGVAGLVMGAAAGSKPMAAAPGASLALALAGGVAAAVATGAIAAGPAGLGGAVAVAALLSLAAGVVVAGLAALRLGRLAAFMPYPVLAGFVNGTALLLALSQLGPVAGKEFGQAPPDWAGWHALGLVVVLAGLAAMALPQPALLLRVPRVLRVLLAAWAADALLRLAGLGAMLGPLIGAPPSLGSHLADMSAGLAALPKLPLAALLPSLATGAATVAVLSVLDTLGSAAALRGAGQPRAGASRDLFSLAGAQAASAAAGGLPVSASLVATMACLAAGGRGRLSVLVRAGLVLLVVAAGGPVLAQIPQAALSAVVLSVAWTILDGSTIQGLRGPSARHRAGDAAVMAAVAGLAVAWSLAAAVATGILLAVLAFTASMARGTVRHSWRNPGGRSRTRRPAWAEAVLLAAGQQIEVAELEGAIFFGSAEAVSEHVERAAASGARYLILDLARVTRVDLSGGRQLVRLAKACPPGTAVLLAGMRPGCPAHDDLHALGLLGDVPAAARFDSLESALDWSETQILAAHSTDDAGHDAAPATALERMGVPAPHVPALLAAMCEEQFGEGAAVIRRGDAATTMFLLLSGVADITIPRAGVGGEVRVSTLAPGAMFGEMALLTGHVRSATVSARTPLTCLRLDRDALACLQRDNPAAATALLHAIARQLDSNLRMANTTILSLDR